MPPTRLLLSRSGRRCQAEHDGLGAPQPYPETPSSDLANARPPSPAKGGRRGGRRFLILVCVSLLSGCATLLETDQARLCRMTIVAVEDPDATIRILKQTPFPDGRGLRVDYLAGPAG